MHLLLLLLCLFTTLANANVAVDELNTLLAHQTGIHGEKPSPELRDLSDNYYLLFIYRSDCPHCHQFAPVLADFAKTFKVNVEAYSVDGKPLAGFEANRLSPELFHTLYLNGGFKTAVPALFLVNRHTLQTYAVLFGEASPYELAARFHELMQHIKEQFND
ncbi:conjugative transfer protein TrbB [Legionella donaldsonii]|uniref:Conjugative transfer protein TrbB n=2 Tax=Legionella donaldsonii TaxID=45060 RepID=A0A378KKK9_9GAMM|nr:conjugative transfer protein TrbB [Legionella donaldsonii]